MPKKLSKSKKRPARRASKKTFLEKLFTFPKLVVFGVIVLSFFTVYQVTKPTAEVMGETTTASTVKYKIRMTMFADPNMNVKRDSGEGCLAKTFKVKVKNSSGKTTSYTLTGNKDCTKFASPVITATGKCNTVEYVDALANWYLSGINYSDSVIDPGYEYDSNKVRVCYYPPSEGLSVPAVAYVNFAMKSK